MIWFKMFLSLLLPTMQSEDDQSLSGVPLTALCYDMEARILISGDQSGTVSVSIIPLSDGGIIYASVMIYGLMYDMLYSG